MDVSKKIEIGYSKWNEQCLVYVLHNKVMLMYYIDHIAHTAI
jgi:hypothetical protein